ncbi:MULTISPECIES: ribonuclease HI [Nonlabens]|uniref:ribonuclease H n=2 Tax=Nonlabens TaxID=363408 RepID=A0A081D806_NONUL|nr:MULTISPECIES: ribonuclease HI [Nonlabens]KEZ92237.1 ribonuclease HI [Nonlabens ulvanivorans]PQJ31690.1 ribonuclease HI [Nonlabens arenilitoris]PRX15067.1 ribonuclease HI [Nonlabens ulvanivorans]GAK75052.1 ribonuclease HI [Nonlabens ulvanivorans]GAK92706.1 ribonuclease HI [Nonlabens ulvanivorans]
MEQVHIYTDGSSRGNPGPGGYGIVMIWVGKKYKKEFSQGYRRTTNNRMELLAVIEALEKIKMDQVQITVFTDSKYVSDAVNKNWIAGWIKRKWKNVKNPDLWKRFIKAFNRTQPKMQWVKGHNDHPINERCDALAVGAALNKSNHLVDEGFEASEKGLF